MKHWIGAIITLLLLAACISGAAWVMADDAKAAGGGELATCEVWADIKPWAITRCENWDTGEVCLVATSGFVVCRFE